MGKRDYQDQQITFIPVSALKGDNVVHKSENMAWYKGQTLLEHLEDLDMAAVSNIGTPRFPVQLRHTAKKQKIFMILEDFAGKVYGGELSVGDEVIALPSQTKSKNQGDLLL